MQFRNFLLAALPPRDAAVLELRLREVTLSHAQVLWEAGRAVDTLYFPSSACLSVVVEMRDGKSVEIATVGRESAGGLLDVITDRPPANRCFVQIGGAALALRAEDYRARLADSPDLLRLTLLHVRATAGQAETAAASNVVHTADNRLARWLLMTGDRVGSDSFPLTQDYMAVMTGVQRSTVSVMAAALKKDRVIDYARGRVEILDRPRLVRRACECYSTVEDQFEALRLEPQD